METTCFFGLFSFFKILIQGCLATEENINFVLESVHRQLMELEDFLAKTTSTLYCDICSSDEVRFMGIRDSIKNLPIKKRDKMRI